MPAYQNMSPSSSLSDYSNASSQLTDSMLFTFSEFLECFETADTYDDLMVTLFKRQDLIIKTNEMKHLAGLVQCLQNKISMLQEYMQESFNTMEAGGLHQLLQKRYVWYEGTMRRQQELWFDLSTINNQPSSIRRPSTPYPRSQSSSPQIKKPINTHWWPLNILQLHLNMKLHLCLRNLNLLVQGYHLFQSCNPLSETWFPT